MRKITKEELALHNTEQSLWMAVHGVVYDLTQYAKRHPGGKEKLMEGAGMDATDKFDHYHPWINHKALTGKLMIGTLERFSFFDKLK